MSKISKKLLSLAIVLAMVLSMTPVISLPAAAATAAEELAAATARKAEVDTWVTNNAAAFTAGENLPTTCPTCNAENVVWTAAGSAIGSSTAAATSGHYYFPEGYTTNKSTFIYTSNSAEDTLCLYLNGQNISCKGQIRARNNLNIFGTGGLHREHSGTLEFFKMDGVNGTVSIYGGAYTSNYSTYPLFGVRGGTLNIYGGTFSHSANGIFNISKTDSEVNIYGGSITGNTSTNTVELSNGSFNMRAGEVTDATLNMTAGKFNVYGGTFGMKGGSVTDSTIYMAGGVFNMSGGSISGGTGRVIGSYDITDETTGETTTHTATSGGNVYMVGGEFNMSGGSIYGGTATGVKTATDTYGTRGGNVYIGTDSTFNMSGGSIYGGRINSVNGATTYGGNVMLYNDTSRLNMSGDAQIYDGQAINGGNVMMRRLNEMTMTGNAKVYNGVANTGPNIYLMTSSSRSPKLTMSGNATVYGGTYLDKPDKTGNIRLYGGTLIMKDNATVRGGADDGSAISVMFNQNPLVVLMDNATVKNAEGESKNLISDGRILITEGWAGEAYAALIDYDADPDRGYTCGEQIPVEKALIGTYNEETGEVTAANVAFTGKLYVSSNKAEALVDTTVTGGIVLEEAPEEPAPEEPTVKEPVFGEFDPEGCEGMAYCEACYKQAKAVPGTTEEQAKAAALKEWTAYTYKYYSTTASTQKQTATHEHLYLTEDVADFAKTRLISTKAGTICLNLNGKSITKDVGDAANDVEAATRGELFFVNDTSAVLNIMDEKMEGKGASVMTGVAPNSIYRGAAFRVDAGTVNLYGGTFRDTTFFYYQTETVDNQTQYKLDENGNKIVGGPIWRVATVASNGTLNVYEGAVIDGSNTNSTRQTVYVEGGTFHMHGGEIVGRAKMSGSNGGSVYVTNKNDAVGTFTMSGGVIRDGVAGNPDDPTEALRNGGNVAVASGATFEMTGGEIYNGYATGAGANVYVAEGCTFTKTDDAKVYDFGVVSAAGKAWYTSFQAALDAYQITDAAYVGVWDAAELQLTEDAYVALMSGCAPTVSGAYKLYAMDTTQDDYVGAASDWTVATETEVVRDVKNPVSGNRYLNMTIAQAEGTETINSLRMDLALSTVTLRAGKTSEGMGLYYKAKVSMSEALADKVTTYGVVLSLVDMPYANFFSEGNQNGFTAIEEKLGVNAENRYTVTVNSGSVFGIMKEDVSKAADNAARGKMPIFANAYLEIDLDADGAFEYIMADTDETTAGDVAWSLYDVLATINGRWSDFTAAHEKVTTFYSHWAQYGMDAWKADLPNIAG